MPCREHRFSSLGGSCRSLEPLLFCGHLRFHLDDQLCQFLLTFLLAVGIDITGETAAVGESWGISSFPQVFVDLADAPGAGFAALTIVGLECRGYRLSWGCIHVLRSFRLSDPAVNFCRSSFAHFIRDMGIDIESR